MPTSKEQLYTSGCNAEAEERNLDALQLYKQAAKKGHQNAAAAVMRIYLEGKGPAYTATSTDMKKIAANAFMFELSDSSGERETDIEFNEELWCATETKRRSSVFALGFYIGEAVASQLPEGVVDEQEGHQLRDTIQTSLIQSLIARDLPDNLFIVSYSSAGKGEREKWIQDIAREVTPLLSGGYTAAKGGTIESYIKQQTERSYPPRPEARAPNTCLEHVCAIAQELYSMVCEGIGWRIEVRRER